MPARRSDTRARIVSAAAAEFAARGYAGAGVDRIARRARVNKAMIYYHFTDKQALYREILAETYVAVTRRVRTIARERWPAGRKIDAFVEAFVREAEAHPPFLPIILRELAEGGPHLGPQTLQLMSGLLQAVRAIIVEGTRAGEFGRVNPMLAYFTVVGPIVVFLASAPVRAEMGRLHLVESGGIDSGAFIAHLQTVLRRTLAAESAESGGRRRLPAPLPRKRGRT